MKSRVQKISSERRGDEIILRTHGRSNRGTLYTTAVKRLNVAGLNRDQRVALIGKGFLELADNEKAIPSVPGS